MTEWVATGGLFGHILSGSYLLKIVRTSPPPPTPCSVPTAGNGRGVALSRGGSTAPPRTVTPPPRATRPSVCHRWTLEPPPPLYSNSMGISLAFFPPPGFSPGVALGRFPWGAEIATPTPLKRDQQNLRDPDWSRGCRKCRNFSTIWTWNGEKVLRGGQRVGALLQSFSLGYLQRH